MSGVASFVESYAASAGSAVKTDIRNTKLLNAFLSDTSNTWHDASDAFTLLQSSFMDGVEVDDQSKVIGMDAAINQRGKGKVPNGCSTTGPARRVGRKGEWR
jgi:hypothetical protein